MKSSVWVQGKWGLEMVGKGIDRRSVGGEPQGSFLSHGLSVLIQVTAQ